MSRQELYDYYERELVYLRKLAAGFAGRHPAVAARLLLEPNQSQDPHVERLLEAVAFLTARVSKRLDDEYPELSDALLGILHPNYLAPVPSLTLLQFELDPEQGRVAAGVEVARHTVLMSRKGGDAPIRLRTCYPVRLWPLRLEQAEVAPAGQAETRWFAKAKSCIRLAFHTQGGEPLAEYDIPRLRLHLDGEPGLVHALYEACFRQPLGVIVRVGKDGGVRLPDDALQPVGFAADEALLEQTGAVPDGHRLLQEYFALPEKFLFVDIDGLRCLRRAGAASSFELVIVLPDAQPRLAGQIDAANFRLGCTPAVNLFPMDASPIRIDHRSIEYQVVPDHRTPFHHEVHSLLEVQATVAGETGSKEFRPFFSLRHGDARDGQVAYWHGRRAESLRKDDAGTDYFVSLVDPDLRAADLGALEVLHVRALCTNRDLAARLPVGDPNGDLQLEGRAEIRRVRALRQPTRPLRPHLVGESRWRLISCLSLNHLSLVEAAGREGGPSALDAMREMLMLYDFGATAAAAHRIEGLVGCRCRRTTRVVPGVGPLRGLLVELEFDESKYTGAGVFLFAAVLERFLALHASINSFTATEARVQQRDGILKRWPPRSGHKQVL